MGAGQFRGGTVMNAEDGLSNGLSVLGEETCDTVTWRQDSTAGEARISSTYTYAVSAGLAASVVTRYGEGAWSGKGSCSI